MKNRLKHALSLLLCLVMLAALMPSGMAQAVQPAETVPAGTAYYINPFYKDLYTPEQVRAQAVSAAQTRAVKSSAPTYSTVSGAAAYFRKELVNRSATISFAIPTSLSEKMNNPFHELYDAAVAHSESCTGQEGDALLWGIGYWNGSYSYSGDNTVYTYTPHYYSTAAQEKTLTSEVNSAMSSLKLSGKTEKQKIRAIHDYICDRVNYDNEHVSDTSYELQYTAYAAMHNKTAVCQGYAILFYRMCKEAGLDVRVVTSYDHAWNIVRAGSVYYNVDTTWDGGDDDTIYDWYLKGMRAFPDHLREYPYNGEDFESAYPMVREDNLNKANLSLTLTDVAGKSVSTAASGKPRLLIFGDIGSDSTNSSAPDTRYLLKNLADYDLTGLDVVYVDCGENGQYEVEGAARSLGLTNMTICWNDNGRNALWSYLDQCGDESGSIIFPVLIYIDANNKIQQYSINTATLCSATGNCKEYLGLTLKYGAPRITTQPKAEDAYDGVNTCFRVYAKGKGTIKYYWYYRTSSSGSWTRCEDADTSQTSYYFTATAQMDGYQFKCKVSNEYGSVTSKVVTLKVYDKVTVLTQPKSVSAAIGDTAEFKVKAAGGNLWYMWEEYDTKYKEWNPCVYDGHRTDTLSVPVTAALDGARFRCRITDGGGNKAISYSVKLTVKTAITAQPKSASAPLGDTVNFTVKATGVGLKYQWQFYNGTAWNNSTATGCKTATLPVKVESYRNGYKYRCIITDAHGTKTYTYNVKLTVKTVITAQPKSAAVSVGETVNFTVKATGLGLTYQWQFHNGKEWSNSTASGCKTATLPVKMESYRNGYRYRCVITDVNG
ncbi:MAG: transglutaminase domain-containing protein, partial [Oscillospiraceae bacterium]|nr:transglutaminase domain-containing protein [Oscillospiraceae bacterium]